MTSELANRRAQKSTLHLCGIHKMHLLRGATGGPRLNFIKCCLIRAACGNQPRASACIVTTYVADRQKDPVLLTFLSVSS